MLLRWRHGMNRGGFRESLKGEFNIPVACLWGWRGVVVIKAVVLRWPRFVVGASSRRTLS